jgi:hypothetical protein
MGHAVYPLQKTDNDEPQSAALWREDHAPPPVLHLKKTGETGGASELTKPAAGASTAG